MLTTKKLLMLGTCLAVLGLGACSDDTTPRDNNPAVVPNQDPGVAPAPAPAQTPDQAPTNTP